MREQSGSGLSAERETRSSLRLGEAPRAMGVAAEQAREPLGEGATRTIRVAAGDAPDRQVQTNNLAARRQIGGTSPVATMDCSARRSAGWTAGLTALALGGNAENAGTIPSDTKQAATGQRTGQGHTPICAPMPTRAR